MLLFRFIQAKKLYYNLINRLFDAATIHLAEIISALAILMFEFDAFLSTIISAAKLN